MVEVASIEKSGRVAKVAIDAAPFGEKVKTRMLRQAFLHYSAAHRAGTHSTLTRAEVNFNERKPWKQKGTGRARSGDFSSPLWRKGGVAHGPKPRSYVNILNRNVRRESLRSAILGKLTGDQVRLLDGVAFDKPSTKSAAAMLKALGVAGQRVLLVLAEKSENHLLSFRNLPKVQLVPASNVNAEHILMNEFLVLDRPALEALTARLSDA